jgi:hypothetical protein
LSKECSFGLQDLQRFNFTFFFLIKKASKRVQGLSFEKNTFTALLIKFGIRAQ